MEVALRLLPSEDAPLEQAEADRTRDGSFKVEAFHPGRRDVSSVECVATDTPRETAEGVGMGGEATQRAVRKGQGEAVNRKPMRPIAPTVPSPSVSDNILSCGMACRMKRSCARLAFLRITSLTALADMVSFDLLSTPLVGPGPPWGRLLAKRTDLDPPLFQEKRSAAS